MQLKRYNIISYLRVIACVLVVCGHYIYLFDCPALVDRIFGIAAGPVVIFFVISGFLTYQSLETCDTVTYYKKRALRIIPSYYFVLLLSMIFKIFLQGEMKSVKWLRYFFFVNMLTPTEQFDCWNNLYGFWTISCFAVFYLMAPLLHRMLQRDKCWLLLSMATCGLMYVVKCATPYLFANDRFDALPELAVLNPLSTAYLFVFGMVSAYAAKTKIAGKVNLYYGVLLLLMVAMGKGGYVLWGIGTAIIVMFPSMKLLIEDNKAWNVMISFFDRCSFYVYLLHLLVAEVWGYYTHNRTFGGGSACLLICIVGAYTICNIEHRIFDVLRKVKFAG